MVVKSGSARVRAGEKSVVVKAGNKAVLESDLRDKFSRSLVRYMLAYSLGRSLDHTDREVIDVLVEAFEKSDYQIDELLVAIVKSEPFHMK